MRVQPVASPADAAGGSRRAAPTPSAAAGRLAAWIAAAYACTHAAADPDLWGHVRFGLDLLRTRHLSSIDPYSFTQDVPWINHEWMSELLFGLAYAGGGVPGLIALKAGVLAAAFALLFRAARPVAEDWRWWLLAVAIVGLAPAVSTFRPQLWSILLLAVLSVALSRGTRLAWLPLLFAAWANLHGGWIVGLGVAGLWLAGRLLDVRSVRAALPDALFLSAALVATLITPYGWTLWRFLLSTVRTTRDITEWRPLWQQETASDLVLWVLVAGFIGTMIVRRRRDLTWSALLPVAWLGVMSVFVARLLPLFSVVATVFVARAWRLPAGDPGPARTRPAGLLLIDAAVVGAVCLANVVTPSRCLAIQGSWSPDLDAAGALAAAGVRGRLVLPFDWGEYAIWHLAPRLKVSIDGRRETVYSDRTIRTQSAVADGLPEGLAFLDRERPEYSLAAPSPCGGHQAVAALERVPPRRRDAALVHRGACGPARSSRRPGSAAVLSMTPMRTAAPGRERLQLLVVAAAAAVFAVLVTPAAFVLDDGYIALHSARAVVTGQDPVYGVPALTGATSPPYVALLVVLLRIGFWNRFEALRAATLLGVVAYVTGVWAMTVAAGVRSLWARAALTVTSVASGLVIINVTNGLETGWAMALLVWLIALTAGGRVRTAGVVAGLLCCTRLDLAPAAGLVVAYGLVRRSWRDRTVTLGLALLAVLPFLLWNHADTGAWIPATIRAKRLFYAEGCLPLATRLSVSARGIARGVASLLPMAVGLAGLAGSALGAVGVGAMTVSLGAYTVALPGSLNYSYCRYFYPIVAPWCAWGLVRLARGNPRTSIAPLVGLACAAVTFAALRWIDQAPVAHEIQAAAGWIEAHTPADAVLLVHDAGGISELAGRRAVDLVGLKSPASIAAHQEWTWPSCGSARDEAIAAIARASDSSYFVVESSWDQSFHLTDALRHGGFEMQLLRQPSGAGYFVYSLEPGVAGPAKAGHYPSQGDRPSQVDR